MSIDQDSNSNSRVSSPGLDRTNSKSDQAIKTPNVNIPTSLETLELSVLRYRELQENGQSEEEKSALEIALAKISKEQEAFSKEADRIEKLCSETTSDKGNLNMELLEQQISGFQLLSKDLDLPLDLQLAFGKYYYDAEPEQDVSKQNGVSHDKSDVAFGKVTVPYDDFLSKAAAMGIKPSLPYADSKLHSVGLPNHESIITKKISNRILDLESLPSIIGTLDLNNLENEYLSSEKLPEGSDALKVRSLIELKALRLLAKQKQLRKNINYLKANGAHVNVDFLKKSPTTMAAQRSLHIRPKIIAPQTARFAEQLEEQQKQEKLKALNRLQLVKVERVMEVANDEISRRREKDGRRQQIQRHVSSFHSQVEKDESKRMERTAKQRLQALRANDEEAYLKLLDQTKDTRITHLLKQTNSFLDSLAAAVKVQQKESALANSTEEDKDQEEGDVSEDREKIDYYEVAHRVKEEVSKQPSMLVGGQLKDYQIKGVQWMVSLYNNHLNGILADEMGLGKTIQSISLISYLMETKKEKGKFLVIVPLSTITNWALEFDKWAPSIKIIVYKGSPNNRKMLSYDIKMGNFTVLLTTYEYIIKDRPLLSKFRWAHMIIDEGHRMKNAQSKLSFTLTNFYYTKNRLILTGTPLQNNLPELWALLNFVLPKIFNSVKSFDEWFNTPFANTGSQDKMELTEEESLLVIRRLHKVLRPFLLRRLKKDVEKDLPDKVEKVIKCKLSGLQYQIYQQMLKHNALFVGAGTTGATKSGIKGLNNKVMQLRKICNHPYVFEEVENVVNPERATTDMIWRVSGKFELLDRVLPKFKASNHKVLIFFQMTQVMDIMEDFMRYRGLSYLRLDGSTKADDRQDMLKAFNAPESDIFAFLLSTRAGGLGLNLQTADTVIIFDTDWNPHQDLQAQDRAHRIGQKNEVKILRLITNESVEEVILERAQQKLDIDGKVIQAGKFDNKSTAEEQEAFLKRLLEAEQAKRSGQVDDDDLDDDELNSILARDDAEEEMFSSMDLERVTRDKMEAREEGKTLPPRLCTVDELPSIFTEDIEAHLEQQSIELGRTREKKRIVYDDGLTEEQWLDAMDNDEDSVEDAIRRKNERQERRRMKREAGLALDEEDLSEEEETPVKKQKTSEDGSLSRRRRNEKAKPENEKDFSVSCLEFLSRLTKLVDEDGNVRSALFMDLPSKKLYPDYYQLIKKPIGINKITKALKQGKYSSAKKFTDDLRTMFANAKTYNEEGSFVHNNATSMEKFLDDELEELV